MPPTRTRFDLRVPSERTGRPVLPAQSKRRACACCGSLVATGWVLTNGDSVCAYCEAIVSRATEFHGSLDAFAARVQQIDGVALNAASRKYLAATRRWA
ncbi:hypothetical protein RPSD_52180 (plasmid) [Ralstonia solanacearum]|nr:hypothetical protein RPSD_52180 [Ralstonia solanacearum]